MVRANRAFRLIASREGVAPAFLADERRLDRIEVVSVEDGEVVLFWELGAREASRLLRDLRADLAGMDAAEFLDKWQGDER